MIQEKLQKYQFGNDYSNLIAYRNKLVAKTHAKIYLDKGRWTIENLDVNFGTFVNGECVKKIRTLFNGDVVFIMGLKIIVMGNSMYINNPLNTVLCKGENFILHKRPELVLENNEVEYESEELYKEKDYFFRSPRITDMIETESVRIDPPPAAESKEEMPLILTLGTTLTMGLMMLMSTMSTISSVMSGNASIRKNNFFTCNISFNAYWYDTFSDFDNKVSKKIKKRA